MSNAEICYISVVVDIKFHSVGDFIRDAKTWRK